MFPFIAICAAVISGGLFLDVVVNGQIIIYWLNRGYLTKAEEKHFIKVNQWVITVGNGLIVLGLIGIVGTMIFV